MFENGIGGKETNKGREFLGGHSGTYPAAGIQNKQASGRRKDLDDVCQLNEGTVSV